MEHEWTAAAQRVLEEAARWTDRADCEELLAPALLLGLLSESECQAATILARHGIEPKTVARRWPALARREAPSAPPRYSAEVQASLAAAGRRLRDFPRPLTFATEHLLLGLAAAEHETSLWLRQQGLDPDALETEIHQRYGYLSPPLPLDHPPLPPNLQITKSPNPTNPPNPPASEEARTLARPPQSGIGHRPSGTDVGVLRVLDAAWNRTREGLRVVEDYTRFVLDDRHLTDELKQLRHALAAALAPVPLAHRLAARETRADVGTQLATPAERRRQDAQEVLTANFIRVQEGLRSLEEYSKILDPDAAARLEQLRYRAYTLHRSVAITQSSLKRLGQARLYVLLDGHVSPQRFEILVDSLVGAGVHVLQLRDKTLDDRRLLERARLLRQRTRGTGTLFVMNDRPDLAVLAGADGVHVGQEELTVKDVRTLVGPEMLVGVSTHSLDQARQAVLDGADYLGVGPTFPSGTKAFDHFPGLDFVRQVAAEIRLPAFAIGGINRTNLPEVLAAGLPRIAVSGVVTTSEDPAVAARELLAALGAQL